MKDALKRLVSRFRAGGEGGGTVEPSPDGAQARAAQLRGEGAEHLSAGRLAAAEEALSRALDLRHDDPQALLLQALVYKRQGRVEDAADSLVLAEHFAPGLAEVQFQLGLIDIAQGRLDEAQRRFRRAVAADDRHAMAWNALGALLFKAGVLEEAAQCFRQAIAIQPDHALAHSNLGCVLLTHLDEWQEGAAHIETAWRLAPHEPDVMLNWAMLLQQRGRLPEALALWTRIVERGGADVEKGKLNRALVLLKQGEFARGWSDYEARKRTESEYAPRDFPYPEWNGEPLAGRTILAHAEQGIGDQIMFASCVPDLLSRAGHCIVECDPKLESIFRRSFPAATVMDARKVVAGGLAASPIDCHVALGSLPLRFRSRLEDFPVHDGYLRADAGAVAAWKQRLAALPGRRRVGISWRGGMKRTRRSMRSVPLEEWLPVLRCEEVAFVSLQYTDCRAELSDLERDHGIRVHHWQEAIDDYDQTAALVSALDLVISVQTSIVHLGGALGRPVWVMVPAVSEWRYLASGEVMPWYPAVRIFRQPAIGQWEHAIARVRDELRKLTAS